MAIAIRIQGLVQGVGFRPFIWHLANRLGITGHIWNDAEGVIIHAWASDVILEDFQHQIRSQLPPLARIDHIESSRLDTTPAPTIFSIEASRNAGHRSTAITPDAATCQHCITDIRNANDRHHGYAFTSCSYCGPRLSIVDAIPYDRANTSMNTFPMCVQCQAEYDHPTDRRFHTQTNACPDCGPQLNLEDISGNKLNGAATQIISQAAALLKEGHIVAIKGIGGIHLAVDANNHHAVLRLRSRKQRYGKAFALMAPDAECIRRYAKVTEPEARLLASPAAPIVLLKYHANGEQLSEAISPGQSTLGFILPYSPLHHLLMTEMNGPIVLTSGNRSDEPQCINNDEARLRLKDIADYFLLHDRDINNRLDDSVAMLIHHEVRLMRRARGYAPAPILLHKSFAATGSVLAMGGELKNTFCQLSNGQAIVSQHLGDLENSETHRDYLHTLAFYEQVFAFKADMIAVDKHPDYFSTRLGQELSETSAIPLLHTQHHHAHIAAVLAEHQYPVDTNHVLGIALDGLGFGDDETIWGGEFLLANYTSFTRLGCFQPVTMPGGSQAIQQPWRNTLAHLHALDWRNIESTFGDTEFIRFLTEKPLPLLRSMIEKGINAPLTTSCGRLFDAVAAALGICSNGIHYEGQAAIELECLAKQVFKQTTSAYPYRLNHIEIGNDAMMQVNWQPMWHALLNDLKYGIKTNSIAARFHRTVIAAVGELAMQFCHDYHLNSVVLCGGAFQNSLLLETLATNFEQAGFKVLIAQQLPINDGGLSLGQAAIAAVTQIKGNSI